MTILEIVAAHSGDASATAIEALFLALRAHDPAWVGEKRVEYDEFWAAESFVEGFFAGAALRVST